jgi:hypothetical protein
LFYLCRFHSDMETCRPTLFLLTVKEILLVHFIITNFRVAHKMLCTPWLRNPLTTSRLSCLGRKAALTTIFLSVRQSRISQPCYTNNYFVKCRRQTIRFVLNDRYCKIIKKNIRGDQEGLFELAIQLRTFFCSAICNTATGYGLFDRYLT